jgi:hypothetical protein
MKPGDGKGLCCQLLPTLFGQINQKIGGWQKNSTPLKLYSQRLILLFSKYDSKCKMVGKNLFYQWKVTVHFSTKNITGLVLN